MVPKFYLMVPNGTKWFSMIQNGTQRHQMVTNGTWWYPMIISYRNESIYMSAEWSNAGLWRSNFRLDTSDRNFLNVNQGNKGGPLKISLLPFCCGWLSLKKVNLCIFEGWSNVGLGRSSFRPDTLDKKILRIHQRKKISTFYCWGWLLIHICCRDGQIHAWDGQTSSISQTYFRPISSLSATYLWQLGL